MKKLLILLTLLPSLALAQQSTVYLQGDTIGTSGAYGQMQVCDGGTTAPLVQCDASGQLVIVPGVPTTNATFAAANATATGAIGAAYALGVDLPASTKVVILDNQTNGDVVVSMDAGVSDTFFMKGGDKLVLPLATVGLVTTAIVHLKDGTTASTAGTFYIYSYK